MTNHSNPPMRTPHTRHSSPRTNHRTVQVQVLLRALHPFPRLTHLQYGRNRILTATVPDPLSLCFIDVQCFLVSGFEGLLRVVCGCAYGVGVGGHLVSAFCPSYWAASGWGVCWAASRSARRFAAAMAVWIWSGVTVCPSSRCRCLVLEVFFVGVIVDQACGAEDEGAVAVGVRSPSAARAVMSWPRSGRTSSA